MDVLGSSMAFEYAAFLPLDEDEGAEALSLALSLSFLSFLGVFFVETAGEDDDVPTGAAEATADDDLAAGMACEGDLHNTRRWMSVGGLAESV